jgi:hypothetical protein
MPLDKLHSIEEAEVEFGKLSCLEPVKVSILESVQLKTLDGYQSVVEAIKQRREIENGKSD